MCAGMVVRTSLEKFLCQLKPFQTAVHVSAPKSLAPRDARRQLIENL
jgi:hypothetical protein